MRTISKKSRAAIAGAVVVAIAGGGVAYGYWTTNGSGTGSATSSAGPASLTITQTAAPANLAPGLPAGVLSGSVKNTAAHSSYVRQVTVSISSVTLAEGAIGACSIDDYTLRAPVMPVGAELASNESASFSGATLEFHDDKDTNQDGCKGATVHLSYSAS